MQKLSKAGRPSWLRTLWAMMSVQFIMGVAFSIIPPVIPFLLPSVGITSPDAVRLWAGLVLGVTPLAAALMSPWWGIMADRMDRRVIILISCGSVALCTACMSFVTHPAQLLALRFGMGLFGGHMAAGLSLVFTTTPASRLGYALGWMATAQLAGSLLGPLIGGAIADAFGNFRAPFFGATLGTVFVAAAVGLIPNAQSGEARTGGEPRPTLWQLFKRPDRASLILVLMLVQCAIMAPQPVVSLMVLQFVGQRPELATLAGFAFSVIGLSGLVGSPLLGVLSDSFGAQRLLLLSMAAAAVATFAQILAPNYVTFVAERFVAGLFLGGIVPSLNASIGRSVSEGDGGRIYGLTSSAAFLGGFLGPVSGGALAAGFGLRSVLLGSGATLLVTAAWLGLRRPLRSSGPL